MSRLAGILAILAVGNTGALGAQPVLPYHDGLNRYATTAEVIAGNALVGGIAAALQATVHGKDPFRAFGIGAVGGLVHLAGKNFAVEGGAARAWGGLLVGHAGTSIVLNAGRGVHPFQELVLPLGPMRLRVLPRDSNKVRASVNLFEAGWLLRTATRDGIRFDWERTFSTGALAFVTEHRMLFRDDEELAGVALAPYYLLSEFARDVDETARHEVVHLFQQQFIQETLGWPLEQLVRSRIWRGHMIPRWIEVGVGGAAIATFDHWISNGDGLRAIQEAEAQLLHRR
ncbi:MAG TPA: hypothetical protein VEB19_02825 [Gemmatimonadaceae bacterium]|nr:hypothetical protein [Gemmatimonadaceae bacterium]